VKLTPTPLTRWRQRRQSVKELHQHDDAVYEEYLKLRALDQRSKGPQPPSYGVVVGLSGVVMMMMIFIYIRRR
jgi:hypothetical protein